MAVGSESNYTQIQVISYAIVCLGYIAWVDCIGLSERLS